MRIFVTLILSVYFFKSYSQSFQPIRGNYFYLAETETSNSQWGYFLSDTKFISRNLIFYFSPNEWLNYLQSDQKKSKHHISNKNKLDKLTNNLISIYKSDTIDSQKSLLKALNHIYSLKSELCTSQNDSAIAYKIDTSKNDDIYYQLIGAFKHAIHLTNDSVMGFKLSKALTHELLMPNFFVWKSPISYNEPYCSYYFYHPAYKDYPVVGISYNQSTIYCAWITKKWNHNLQSGIWSYKDWNTVTITLPTKLQWEYAAKGGTLASQQTSLATGGVAIVDFADLSFTGVTLTARGALIYNSTEANKAVCVLDFGADKTATSGTFTIQFPNFTSSAAILRIA